MNTLTAATVIDLPCPHCHNATLHPNVRCADVRHGTTFAVCVVDVVAAGDRLCWVSGGPDNGLSDLTELTEPCRTCGGETIYPDVRYQHLNPRAVRVCPDCIDGRPAVEVERVELCQMCDTDCRDYGRGECKVDGVPYGPTVTPLGRGTVEHVLPVFAFDHEPETSTDHIEEGPPGDPAAWWTLDEYYDYNLVKYLDIDVTPGQYIILVRMEEG